MMIGINDLDDDEDVILDQPEPSNVEPGSLVDNQPNEDSVLQDFLRTKGIEDYNRIKFESDNGDIEERSWDLLSNLEKLNILNTPVETNNNYSNSTEDSLTDEEIALINEIRNNNLTPSLYMLKFKLDNIVNEPQYKIDDLSDDELYLLDFESRVGELSDEEASLALARAKENEDLYKKQVEGIRKEYKEREDFYAQQLQAEQEEEYKIAYNDFQNNVINSIDNFNSIGDLDLNFNDDDKNYLAQFMLSKDEAGNNYLYLALQDPDNLVKAAWFILNGEEAINNISDYFVNLIKLVSQNQYKKGFEDGRNNNKPTLVIDNSQKTISHQQRYNSIVDLDDD